MTPEPECAPPEWFATAWRRFWAGFIDGFVFQPLIWVDGWIWSTFHTPLLLVPWVVFFATSFVAYSVVLHWMGADSGQARHGSTGALAPWRSPRYVKLQCATSSL